MKKNICLLILLLFAVCFAPLAALANNVIDMSNPSLSSGNGLTYDSSTGVYTIQSVADATFKVVGSSVGSGRRVVVRACLISNVKGSLSYRNRGTRIILSPDVRRHTHVRELS